MAVRMVSVCDRCGREECVPYGETGTFRIVEIRQINVGKVESKLLCLTCTMVVISYLRGEPLIT